MKITLEKVVSATESLNWLSEKVLDPKEDVKATNAYALARLLESVNSHRRTFDQIRTQVFQKYGEENKDGELFIPPKNVARFTAEINDLLRTTECDLPDTVIPLKPLLGDLTAARLLQLDWLLEKSVTEGNQDVEPT